MANRTQRQRWEQRHPGYHREWMRRWRADEENRLHERVMQELRLGVDEGTLDIGLLLQEARHIWKVRK